MNCFSDASMAARSDIEWTDATWNPVTGCTKVSAGCKHCYAERIFHRPYPGRNFTDVRCHPERLDQPLRWRKPRRIFVNSMSDLFHEDVADDFIDRVFAVMALAHQHTFQVLTKRPQRMLQYVDDEPHERITDLILEIDPDAWHKHRYNVFDADFDEDGAVDMITAWCPPNNVWFGVSVEDQPTADDRIPLLLQTPASVRFLSCEPLLGPINLDGIVSRTPPDRPGYDLAFSALRTGHFVPSKIDWVIVGGESGPNARPMHPDWARSVRDQCQAAGVPFFFKQWGEWVPDIAGMAIYHDGSTKRGRAYGDPKQPADPDRAYVMRVGKKVAGRALDGRTWDEYPT